MPSAVNVAGDVVAAAAAFAGLILVFLGAISNSFGSYQKTEQAAIRGRYQLRAWNSFIGFILSLLAVVLAIVGKWLTNECLAFSAALLLVLALVFVVVAALLAVREIR